MRVIPEPLQFVADWLARQRIQLVRGNENHRIDSVKSQSHIMALLTERRPIHLRPSPKPTSGWYSFEVEHRQGEWLPVKIKVSSFSRADNLNCKLGIYHALTGVRPGFSDEIGWNDYFHLLRTNLDLQCEEDFYFLVVNRNSSDQVFCNSLKGLNAIRPNGSNVPFQCNWSENQQPSQRTNEEATRYILNQIGESARLRAEMLYGYEQYFGAA